MPIAPSHPAAITVTVAKLQMIYLSPDMRGNSYRLLLPAQKKVCRLNTFLLHGRKSSIPKPVSPKAHIAVTGIFQPRNTRMVQGLAKL